jgi:hypothetical protein
MGKSGGIELRQRAAAEQRKFDECVRVNDVDGALRHSAAEAKLIEQLIKLEPKDNTHYSMLGRVYYNRAHIHDSIGDGLPAWLDAGLAVTYYAWSDPVVGNAGLVRPRLKTLDPDRGAEAEAHIARAADARMRTAWMLAKYRGRSEASGALAEADRALDVYKMLVRHGHNTPRAELRRVRAQYAEIKRFLR